VCGPQTRGIELQGHFSAAGPSAAGVPGIGQRIEAGIAGALSTILGITDRRKDRCLSATNQRRRTRQQGREGLGHAGAPRHNSSFLILRAIFRNRSTRFDIIHAIEAPAHPFHPLEAFACGKTAVIFGWSSARIIGFTFGRIYFSGTESHLRRRTPSPGALLSIAASGSDAMSAAKNISINRQKC